MSNTADMVQRKGDLRVERITFEKKLRVEDADTMIGVIEQAIERRSKRIQSTIADAKININNKDETEIENYEHRLKFYWSCMEGDIAKLAMKYKKPQLQKFSGEFREWQPFKELFEEYVHNNKDISDSKKMSYLKSCIQGDARLMVSHLITESGANYNTAWELLAHRYDNVRKQFNEQLKMEMEKAQTSLSDYQAFAQEKFAALESQLEAQDVEHKRTLDSYRLEIDNKLSQKQQQLDEAEQRELKLKERFNLLAISEQELCEKLTSTENAYAARFQAATEREHNLNERVQALTKELNGLRASNENRERELRDKLNLSQDEISVLRSSQRSFNETLDRSSGISSPSELARLQSEADSLHCVLELKQKEISKLTKHNEELMRDAEERGILQSKISLLESNNEMLKSELDIKLEKEKDFLRKINYKTKGQKESWRATTGRQDGRELSFTDERMDLEPPDEEPNEDKTIKDADDGGMTMEDAVLNLRAKKKRMGCLPIIHIQQLPKGECSEEENTKVRKKKPHIKGTPSSDVKDEKSAGYRFNEFAEIVMNKLIQHRKNAQVRPKTSICNNFVVDENQLRSQLRI
ncbi:glial fibrillary acidic protein-like [Bactrocera dorsalis]|uniref:Glial fibrillary acidic protein-like n=1 Tax=Bactrocera dorsalis TaxID=27457 RepID=A0ABM3J1B1_BACDO|nr:glial fibrillary acidic protein-like [Bactrocera dorsalis]